MAEEQIDYVSPVMADFSTKLRDLEEKQRLLKERLLLIGQNLIETKEKTEKDITEIKIALEDIKIENIKIKRVLLGITEEIEKKARKSEVEILAKQMKMFQPLVEK